MNAKQYQYGWVSIALHWIVAGVVIWLFLNGEQMEHAQSREVRLPLMLAHNSVGVLLIVAALVRTAVRLVKGMPARPKQFVLFEVLAGAVPWLLLVTVLVVIVTGVLAWWSVGRPIGFFGLFDIPSPMAPDRPLHSRMERIHGIASHLILPLAALHVLGALKHLFIDRDGVFKRMMVPARSQS